MLLTIHPGFELGEGVTCVPAASSFNADKNVRQDRVKDNDAPRADTDPLLRTSWSPNPSDTWQTSWGPWEMPCLRVKSDVYQIPQVEYYKKEMRLGC